MFRGGTGWLLSRNSAVAAFGFTRSLIGALGGAFYLEPAQTSEDAVSQQIVLESARARMLRAATAYDDIAGHLGGLLFSVSLPPDASDDERAAIGDLMRRALDHRHDGVRSYLAALAVAGAIDYPAESSRYGALVAAEHANFYRHLSRGECLRRRSRDAHGQGAGRRCYEGDHTRKRPA